MSIEGRRVGHVEVERFFSSVGPPDHLHLFRNDVGWTLLTLSVVERFDADGTPVGGGGGVSAESFDGVAELGEAVADRYGQSAWLRLLDVAHVEDPDLHRAWVPTRIERDFHAASLHRPELARATSLLGGRPTAAPGRQRPRWRLEAVKDMATHLEDHGFEVTERLGVMSAPAGGEAERTLGVLTVRRYGFETDGVVRVDDVGEVFIRMPHGDDCDGPVVTEVGETAGLEPVELEPPALDW